MTSTNTEQVIDSFLKSRGKTFDSRIRGRLDNDNLYGFETKIGKQIFEVDSEEAFELIFALLDTTPDADGMYESSVTGCVNVKCLLSSLFDYYIYNYDVIIRNPYRDPSMRGEKFLTRLLPKLKKISTTMYDDIISVIREKYDKERAIYLECLVQLFYNGFSCTDEIVELKEDMIDFENRIVRVPGRTIFLSEECMSLLMTVHNMDRIEAKGDDVFLVSWHDSYFRFPVRKYQVEEFQDRTLREVGAIIPRQFHAFIKKKYGVTVDSYKLFLLGFYNRLCEKYGEETTREMILSSKGEPKLAALRQEAISYGVGVYNMSKLKDSLKQYI